ncbi:MAG: amino acid racemase [Candidatus Latescibacterota bacterium]
MAKHIGIVGCSAEGAALCYRTLCAEAGARMGEHMHPEVSMHTYPLGEYMVHIRSGNWDGVARLMLSSAAKLAAVGAQIAVCPDNTIHQAFARIAADSPIPWLHIAACVAREAQARGLRTLALLGTKYLMTGPVYPDVLRGLGIAWRIPEESEREGIDGIIFAELVNGVFLESSRAYLNAVVRRMKGQGCDAVVLGCTEIPLLVDPGDCPLPTLDSTRLLARAALEAALEEESPARGAAGQGAGDGVAQKRSTE